MMIHVKCGLYSLGDVFTQKVIKFQPECLNRHMIHDVVRTHEKHSKCDTDNIIKKNCDANSWENLNKWLFCLHIKRNILRHNECRGGMGSGDSREAAERRRLGGGAGQGGGGRGTGVRGAQGVTHFNGTSNITFYF